MHLCYIFTILDGHTVHLPNGLATLPQSGVWKTESSGSSIKLLLWAGRLKWRCTSKHNWWGDYWFLRSKSLSRVQRGALKKRQVSASDYKNQTGKRFRWFILQSFTFWWRCDPSTIEMQAGWDSGRKKKKKKIGRRDDANSTLIRMHSNSWKTEIIKNWIIRWRNTTRDLHNSLLFEYVRRGKKAANN